MEKLAQKRMECFRLLFDHLAWIENQFLSGIRDSRKAGSLWGMMRGVRGVRKSIHQSWLAKGLGLRLGLLCWGFKGVQEEIPREEAITLQIGSVAFPPGQCTSPQLHPYHRLFDQDGHQDNFSCVTFHKMSLMNSFLLLQQCRENFACLVWFLIWEVNSRTITIFKALLLTFVLKKSRSILV